MLNETKDYRKDLLEVNNLNVDLSGKRFRKDAISDKCG